LARLPPAHDHFLAAHVLDFPPRRGARARLIPGGQPLGHHAFQAMLAGGGQDVRATLAGERGRDLPVRASHAQPLQHPAAVSVRGFEQRPPVQAEHVESQEGDRHVRGQPLRPAG
jgi:hypothetical protein